MSKKKTHEEYANEVEIKNPNIEVIGVYINAKTPIMHRCLIHNTDWMAAPTNILDGHGCKKCGVDKVSAILTRTHEQYVEELFLVNPNIIVLERYQGNNTSILHKCLIDGHEWNVAPGDALAGKGCAVCAGNIKKTTEQYKDELKKINPNVVVLDDYINAQTHIRHMCLIDGCIWLSKPNNILNGFGCPQCNESKGERQVRQWLERYGIVYEFQKPFAECCDIKCLPFDFYLPQYNLCIEYDGEQHFNPVDFRGEGEVIALQKFKIVQRHDAIKNKYCEDNNIHLLRIPYFKNVDEELNNFLIHLI